MLVGQSRAPTKQGRQLCEEIFAERQQEFHAQAFIVYERGEGVEDVGLRPLSDGCVPWYRPVTILEQRDDLLELIEDEERNASDLELEIADPVGDPIRSNRLLNLSS